jgi:hypothetical protein
MPRLYMTFIATLAGSDKKEASRLVTFEHVPQSEGKAGFWPCRGRSEKPLTFTPHKARLWAIALSAFNP